MSDQPVATWVTSGGRELPFQEFMIVERAEGPIEGVELRGIERARPSDAVLQAVAEADAIVIGPSNPVISIGPILALPGMREALRGAPAPVVAVSPFVGGRSLKGPTDAFCDAAGIERSAAGVARCLRGRDRRHRRRRAGRRSGGARDRHGDGHPGGIALASRARC